MKNKFIKNRRGFLKDACGVLTAVALDVLSKPLVMAKPAITGLENISGQIIKKIDKDYMSWWSSMTWYIFKPRRFPEMIIRAADEKDVVGAINHASKNGLKVSVRSTGHNPAKSVIRNGGLLLDLSQLRSIEIDPENQTAWIKPGIRSEELVFESMKHDLVFPAAHTGIVGLGGYLLGGGLGWNMPELGIACRSILAAEVITADGKKVTVSAKQNQELHWAVRGVGPGFFGAVVRYQVRLYPAHKSLAIYKYAIPIDRMDQAVERFKKIDKSRSSRLEIFIKAGWFHPVQKPYAERDLVCTVGFIGFGDSEEDLNSLFQPVMDSGIRDISIFKQENIPVTYQQLYTPPETDYSSPNRTDVENCWTDDPGNCLLLLAEKMIKQPPQSPRSFMLSGWGFNTTLDDPSSCIRTDAKHYVSWYLIADKEEQIESNHKWMDESVTMLKPYMKGHYINEIDPVRYPHHVRECFSRLGWDKLARLRKKYDPDGIFHTYLDQE